MQLKLTRAVFFYCTNEHVDWNSSLRRWSWRSLRLKQTKLFFKVFKSKCALAAHTIEKREIRSTIGLIFCHIIYKLRFAVVNKPKICFMKNVNTNEISVYFFFVISQKAQLYAYDTLFSYKFRSKLLNIRGHRKEKKNKVKHRYFRNKI